MKLRWINIFCFLTFFVSNQLSAQDLEKQKENTRMSIVFIDNTEKSKIWLENNHKIFIEKQVPVMIINGTEEMATQLNRHYKGLLSGPAPKPQKYLNILFKELEINEIPAAVIDGKVLQ